VTIAAAQDARQAAMTGTVLDAKGPATDEDARSFVQEAIDAVRSRR
jgi:hypothetical protein